VALTDSQLNQLAALNAGRYPSWQTGEPYLGGGDNPSGLTPPGSSTAGVSVTDIQLAHIALELRRRADRDAVRIVIDRQAGAATYEFDIGATTYTYSTSGATDASVIANELAGIVFDEGDGYIGARVAFDDEYDGVIEAALDVWRLDGTRPTAPTSPTNVTAGDRSADSVGVTLWGLGTGSEVWTMLEQTEATTITQNWSTFARVSPLARLYVQVTGIDRSSTYKERVRVHVGPCQPEPS